MKLTLNILPEEAEQAAAAIRVLLSSDATKVPIVPDLPVHAHRGLTYLAGVLSHNAASHDSEVARRAGKAGDVKRAFFDEARKLGRIFGPGEPGWREGATCQIGADGFPCGAPAIVATPEYAACGQHASQLPWGREQAARSTTRAPEYPPR